MLDVSVETIGSEDGMLVENALEDIDWVVVDAVVDSVEDCGDGVVSTIGWSFFSGR